MTGQPALPLGTAAAPTHIATEHDVAALVDSLDPPMERMPDGPMGSWRWVDPRDRCVVTTSTGYKHQHQLHISRGGGWMLIMLYGAEPIPASIVLAAITGARAQERGGRNGTRR